MQSDIRPSRRNYDKPMTECSDYITFELDFQRNITGVAGNCKNCHSARSEGYRRVIYRDFRGWVRVPSSTLPMAWDQFCCDLWRRDRFVARSGGDWRMAEYGRVTVKITSDSLR